MPLTDSVFGGSTLDQIQTDLLSHYQPADGEPFASDPVALKQRLARKLVGESTNFDDIDFGPAKPKAPKTEKAPDLSDFGDPVPSPSTDDLSSFGEQPKAEEKALGITGNLGAAAKGLAHGAPEAVGGMMQGAAALTHQKPESADSLALIEELQNSASLDASGRAKLMGLALRTIGDRGLQMDYNAALQRIARGANPYHEATDIRAKYGLINTKAAEPVEESPAYKAGKATKEWIDKTVPMTEAEKDSIGGRVGSGISAMGPYLIAGALVGPEVGLILGAAGMGSQTAGDTFQRAKEKGVSDEQAVKSAGWSGAVGAALGTLPLAAVFKPVSQAAPGFTAWMAAKLVQAGQSGITFATVGEAQEYLLQQIAKEQYDPQAGYSPDAKRVIASLLTGGILGTFHPLTPKPSDLSSPEAIADFIRRASEANGGAARTPDEQAAYERGQQTRSEIDEFLRQREQQEAGSRPALPGPEGGEGAPAGSGGPPRPEPSPSGGEAVPNTERTEIEGLKRHGWTDEEIASMTPAQRRAEFQEAMATGESQPPKAAPSEPAVIDRASLMQAHEGKDGFDINAAGKAVVDQVRSALDAGKSVTMHVEGKEIPITTISGDMMADAKGQRWGIMQLVMPSPGDHNRIEIGAETPVNATPGTRAAPIKAETAEDVLAAQPSEPKSDAQAQAENYKHAHVEIDHLGLAGRHSISIETGAGQVRRGVDADGKPWEVTMPVPYGRIKGTKGADGQPLDIFIGPEPSSPHVFIVDQHHNHGGFDEHKIMAGFPGPDAALRAYADSYNDQGANRIGHVTALTPEQFRDWLKGDTTQPLKRTFSEEEIGNLFDEIVGVASAEKGEEPGPSPDEMSGSSQLPHALSDGGRSPGRAGAEKEGSASTAAPREGDVISPAKVHAEPTAAHHAQIEAVLGRDYDHVLPVDVARAAEILAEDPSIPPQIAFQHAVIENAATQNLLTFDQLEQAYGPRVKELLESEPTQPHSGGEAVEVGETGKTPASGSAEAGKLSSGGEAGASARSENPPSQDRQQHDAQGQKPDASRTARRKTAAQRSEDSEGSRRSPSKVEREPDAGLTDKPPLVDSFVDRLTGIGFKNILDARRLAREHGVEDLKAVEETMELAAVKAARQIIEASKDPYPELVKLYGKQPKLGTRTSTSVRDQAYSTPVPLGYLAQKLAGISKKSEVFEPTAGNGALLTAADPAKVLANEINSQRASNLRSQGFKPLGRDATNPGLSIAKSMDVVIANPPFGAVKEKGESKVFDMSDIQPGYRTHEIDHAIALHALEAMKDDGRAVLIVGGPAKTAKSEEARSDAYNGKAKREFYKTLYDRYNVTDHFTVAGELYERQGAGWPVDVIVIDGRGKSDRALPAVDVPRIYDSWEALGGLLNGQSGIENAGAAERPAGVPAAERPGLAGDGRADRAVPGRGKPSGRSGQEPRAEVVRDEPVRGQSEAVPAGRNGDQEQGGPVRDRQPVRSGEQPAAERSPSRLTADEIGDIFDDLVPADDRPAAEVAKSAVGKAASAADDALAGLTALFGGGKSLGSGLHFDEQTYAKAKPLFVEAAEKFADSKHDIRELMRRMLDHLKDAYKWTTDMLRNAKPYVVKFIQDVQDGAVNLLKPEVPKQPTEPVEQPRRTTRAAETAGQALYDPQSKVPGLDTLVPVNMKKSIADALAGLEKRVGPVDDFVAKELGYDKAELEKYFGAEQVDALGLAIDNLNQGKGFIIGDQTGIGKGRVNAAIIKWAMRKGRVPVFVTEKPGLYADMFRDMTDIGMAPPRILATNAGLSMPLDDAGQHWIKTADSGKHNALMLGLKDPEKFRERFDLVFTNYSQMQTLKGENTDRRRFMSMIIPQSTIIFDESHNAGGQAKERKAKNISADRAEFARDLVQRANGVFYSSATYAKRPDVMSLYSATDMAMAVDDINSLGEAIAKGGIPMQQAVAAMLSKAGQYIRRERSFSGINYNTPAVAVDHNTYNQISQALSAIQDFSKVVKEIAKDISRDLKAEAATLGTDSAVGDAGASSTNFTSKMHNIINQMLLSMKAPEAARMAIEHIRNGEKPVLTVANTMESFLKEYADEIGINPGDELEADFSDVLMKYLNRTRRISMRKPFSKEKAQHHDLTDAELGPIGRAAYAQAQRIISAMDLAHLPISPIDHLKAELQKAGYEVGEITGRGLVVDYTGEKPVLRARPGGEITTKGRNEMRRRFNLKPENGGLHAIIINQAGSTGISMHASEKFEDRSKRRMMIVQAEGNIDTHMQLLGRVNRTGQVVLPEYDQLVASIPAEKRPAAVLAKKMASLNANTTASRTSAVTAKDVPDFMNEYGDLVAANYLRDNFEMNERLAWPITPGEGALKHVDAMRKLTGRIPLLPLDEQQALYEHLEEEYGALIKQLEASGVSPLEAKTVDLKARPLEVFEVQGPKNASGSPFAAPVMIEKVSALRQGKPMSPKELIQRVADRLGVEAPEADKAAQWLQNGVLPYLSTGRDKARGYDIELAERTEKLKEFNDYLRPLLDKIDDVKEQEAERTKFNAIKDRWTEIHQLVPVGARVRLNMFDANPVAVVLDVKPTGKTKNPLALGSWKATFAVADASRQIVLPFSRLFKQGGADSESLLDVEVVPTNETAQDTLARFEMMQAGSREDRYIATGNLLAAYDWLNMKGAIINYTDQNGAVHQGILTPKDFEVGKHAIAKGRVTNDPAEIKTQLDQNQTLWSKDRQVNLSRADRWSDNYQIQAEKKKATGGRYYLDPKLTEITGDFYSRGGMMTATVPASKLPAAIKRMQEIGAQFTIAAAAPKAQKVESPELPPDDEPPTPPGGGLAAKPETVRRISEYEAKLDRLGSQEINDLRQKLRAIVRRVAGPGFDIEFNLGRIKDGSSVIGYGEGMQDSGAVGMYLLDEPLIKLALTGTDEEMATAAYHESFHAIEDKLLSDAERELMHRETDRLRQWIKGKTRLSDYRVDQLAGYEVRAIAFQTYARERAEGKAQAGSGLHIMARRIFDRLIDLFHQIRNALAGYGLKTYKDVFGEAFDGGFAERDHLMGNGIDAQSLAASWNIFRGEQDQSVNRRLREVMNSATAFDRVKEKVQNLNEGVKRLEDAVQARMEGELPDSKAFYQKKRLFPGKVATEVQDFNKQHLDPLIDTLRQRGLTLAQAGDILYAQHAAERNAYIDTINPEAEGMGSGMSNEDAEAILARFDRRDLEEIAHRVDGIRDFILDTMVNSGLESRATTDAWRAQYEHYVPLGGFEDPREGEETFREPGQFKVRGREVKRAFGRSSKANNPLVNLLDQAYRTVERAKKNEYLRSLKLALSGVDADDRKGFVMFDRGKPRREIDPRTGLVRYVDDSSYRYSPKAVPYKVGGHTHYMVFESEQVAEVLRRMHPDGLNGVGQALLNIQNKLKAMWTHYSPEFLIRHFIFRYPIEGTLNSFEQGPSNVPRYMADAVPFLGRASKAIFASNKGEVHADPDVAQYQRYWEEMRKAGGAMAFRQARDMDLLREHLEKKLASISGKPLANIKAKHQAAVEAMDTVTNALDNSLRLAAYATARQQGKTPEQAAIIARDATVDFQQSGQWKNFIGLWFPFGNVAIQTGARMGAAVVRSKIMRRVFAGTVAAGFMSAMYNYLIGGDDKDGVAYYDKVAEWDKHLNVIIMNPFHRDDKGRPVPIKIPMPYNWAFPFALGQALGTMAFSKTRGAVRKMIAMSTMAGVEAFSPFAQEGNLAALLAPELTRPLVHTYTNQNWTGSPVHMDPDYQKGPRSESGFRNTGEGWKYSARMLNTMSGGDKRHSGYIDMFPEDLRELFDYYSGTGTQRRFVTNATTTAQNAVGGKPVDYSRVPLARVFMGADYDSADRAHRQEKRREEKRPWEHR